MHRNPFSTIAPLVPDGDYLISAQAMEYTAEYHRIAARAAEFQLISRDDPGLCAAAMDPKAPIGAAMPDLSHQMRRLLLRLRNSAQDTGGVIDGHLDAMDAAMGHHRAGLLDPSLAADLAHNLERVMLCLSGPRNLLEATATLIARLSDTAALTERHQRFNGYCSDLAVSSNYPDLRDVAHSLTRDGTLSPDDPRVWLNNDGLDVLIGIEAYSLALYVLLLVDAACDRLSHCRNDAFAPNRLRSMAQNLQERLELVCMHEHTAQLDLLRTMAQTTEGLAMNLHLKGRPEDQELSERLLSTSVLTNIQAHAIAVHLRDQS